ncbi:MAG: hypothetical protein ABJC74_16810 [Gemmatimonadota bacterium]
MSLFSQRNPRIFATLLLVLLGGGGFGLGFAADRALFHYRFARAMATGRLPREPVFPDRARILDRMVEDLDLTPAQQAQVDSLLATQTDSLHVLMTRMRTNFRDLSARTRARIDSVLTDSQRVRLPRTSSRIPIEHEPEPGERRGIDREGNRNTPPPVSGPEASSR